MDERGISGREVVEALRHPRQILRVPGEPDQRKYVGQSGVVVVVSYSSFEANMVTTFRRSHDQDSTAEEAPQAEA